MVAYYYYYYSTLQKHCVTHMTTLVEFVSF